MTNLIPFALSSQLDETGEERIHAASYTKLTRPTFSLPPDMIFAAVDNVAYLQKSSDFGLTFPDQVATGLPTTTSEVCVAAADGRLFHFGISTEGRTSTDGSGFVACTGLNTTSGFTPGTGTLIKVGNEWQLYHWGLHVSVDGVAFTERTVSAAVRLPVVQGTTVLAISSGRFLAISTDSGNNFAAYSIADFASSNGIQRLLATDTGFLAFGQSATGTLLIGSSATGLSGSWTTSAGPATALCHGVARNTTTGRIVLVLKTGATYYSDNNGGSWSLGAACPYGGAGALPPEQGNNMIFTSDAFFFCARQGGGINRIYRSVDGTDAWVSVFTAPNNSSVDSIAVLTQS